VHKCSFYANLFRGKFILLVLHTILLLFRMNKITQFVVYQFALIIRTLKTHLIIKGNFVWQFLTVMSKIFINPRNSTNCTISFYKLVMFSLLLASAKENAKGNISEFNLNLKINLNANQMSFSKMNSIKKSKILLQMIFCLVWCKNDE
jgi:hypothetical protein